MSLPVELIAEIAATPETFAQLLALPPFARYVRANREHVLSKFIEVVKFNTFIRYYLGRRLHRDGDLPAEESMDPMDCDWRKYPYSIDYYISIGKTNKKWYRMGKLHRDGDKPAVEYINGTKEWYRDGERHRDNDLPAIECANGNRKWYQEGMLHREGNYAIKRADGTKIWCRWGKTHRVDGPAVEYSFRSEEWWINGKQIK